MTRRTNTAPVFPAERRRTLRHRLVSVLLAAALGSLATPGASAQAPSTGAWYPVSGITTSKTLPIRLERTIAEFPIELGRTTRGFVEMRDGAQPWSGTVSGIVHDPPVMFSAGALRSIERQILEQVNEQLTRLGAEYQCVQVAALPSEIDPVSGRDLRPPGNAMLSLRAVIDGPRYLVGQFVPTYRYERLGGLPSADELMQVEVALANLPTGAYAAPRPGAPTERRTLAEWSSSRPTLFHASALVTICNAIVGYMNERQIVAVYVAPDPQDIAFGDVNLLDLRRGTTDLELIILTAVVKEIRTVASGARIKDYEPRIDNPKHARIRADSPVQPAGADGDPTAGLLEKDRLDNYVFKLNRHPGRRVDMALSAAEGVGGVILDYLVAENKSLFVYGQISNTGTKQTDSVRERFGLVHTQLTGRDDVLSLDFITTSFDDESNAVLGSYEAPFLRSWPKWRWRVSGSYSDYSASEVGFAGETFSGESWSIGAELIYNFYQHRETFLDLVMGIRWDEVDVSNTSFGIPITGEQDFFLPHVGVRLERTTQVDSVLGSLMVEWSMPGVTSVETAELNNLGRLNPDEKWVVLQWDLGYSTFLEPILNRGAWADITTPDSSTLAHELALSFRGQWAMDESRLIPQAEQVVGGLYSVRGYPESVIAADTVLIGSIEYRYHVPRAFRIQEPRMLFGQPFRYGPQYVYGRPDWDLILKGFFDIGHTDVSEPFSFEENETLLGAGVGMELQFKLNFNLRLDWGFTLDNLESANVNSGSNRLHVVATIIF